MSLKNRNPRKGRSASADLSEADRVPAAILFGDMKGSTAAAEKDELATVKVLRGYLALIETTVRHYSPRFYKVKAESDGFMARFANAHVMVECGIAPQQAFRERQWKVRLGGNCVEAFEDADGDLLGADMNRTARIASAADADKCQFLVAQSVPPVVRDRLPGVSFEEYGAIDAKGVDGGLLTYEVVRSGSESLLEKRRRAYLDAVARAHEWIDLGGLVPQVGTELLRVGLDDVFVHLSAVRSVPEIDHFQREEIRLRGEVDESARAPRQCPVVVTSRIVGYRDAPLPAGESGFAHFTVSAFGDSEITRFLERWYKAIASTGQLTDPGRQNARTLARGISQNPSVRRLATNPLLVTLIALIYWREVKLPRRRIELYRAAAATLLEKWRQVGLDVRESTSILMAVAFEMHSTSGVGLITRPKLERILVALKMDPKRGGRSEMDAERETQAFLKLIGEQSGILFPRGLDDRGFEVFGFLHLTFEEYFAARELVRRWKQGQVQLCDYLHLPRWREILLLASAHLSDEDDDEAPSRFVRLILDAKSPYEAQLRRDLLLAAECLADDAVVYPDVCRDVLNRLDASFTTTIVRLNTQVSNALAAMAGSRVAVDALALAIGRLGHRHLRVRYAAASAVGALGQAGATPQVLDALLPLLRDTDMGVRDAAARAVGALGDQAATRDNLNALADLIDEASDKGTSLEDAAYKALLTLAEYHLPS
jgi:hypothetical protein